MEKITNGDRIRSMKDEELNEFIRSIIIGCWNQDCNKCALYNACSEDSDTCIINWLKQEVEHNNDN